MKRVSGGNRKRGPARSAHRQAAEEAGISRGLMYRCLNLAAIPAEDFEAALANAKAAGKVPSYADLGLPRYSHGRRTCPHCGGDLSPRVPPTIDAAGTIVDPAEAGADA